jgi:6-phosphogluconolactonase
MKRFLFLFYSLVILIGIISSACREKRILFATGYAAENEKGMTIFEFNPGNGDMKLISETDAGPNPSFFCFSVKHKLIYALNEVMKFKGISGSGITTLQYNSNDGRIEKKSEISVPYGGGCHISLSADEGFLFIANYSSGSIAVVKLNTNGIPETVADTILYSEKVRDVSHAHMISQDPEGKHVYLTDLGLDRIMIYDFNKETGMLSLMENGIVALPEGSGPRHFVFNSEGTKMYLINELNSTVIVLNVDNAGRLNPVQTVSTVKVDFKGKNSCAEIMIGKDGKFLYGSNRGENTIVIFKITDSGTLDLAGHISCKGNWPRNFVIDPSGKFLLVGNQRSNEISVFRINNKTGLPEDQVSHAVVKAPACLEFWK